MILTVSAFLLLQFLFHFLLFLPILQRIAIYLTKSSALSQLLFLGLLSHTLVTFLNYTSLTLCCSGDIWLRNFEILNQIEDCIHLLTIRCYELRMNYVWTFITYSTNLLSLFLGILLLILRILYNLTSNWVKRSYLLQTRCLQLLITATSNFASLSYFLFLSTIPFFY